MTDHEYKWLWVRPGSELYPIGLRISGTEHGLTLEQCQEIVRELMHAISYVAATAAGNKECVAEVPLTDSLSGPFLVTSDSRVPWQCGCSETLMAGLSSRQQWSEPFSVFCLADGKFVECQLNESEVTK